MAARSLDLHRYSRWALAGVCLMLAALLFVAFFAQVKIEGTGLGVDWWLLWKSIEGGRIDYSNVNAGGWLRNPPWSLVVLLPLGLLPMRTGWVLLDFFTLVVLIASVPQVKPRWRFWLSTLLLVISRPALAHFADGNFEGLVIAGLLLTIHAYSRQQPFLMAVGVLLATAKPQDVVLVMPVVALYVVQTWQPRAWLKTGMVAGAVVGVSMLWLGGPWLNAMFGHNLDRRLFALTLAANLNREGVAPPVIALLWLALVGASLWVAWRGNRDLSREKVGMLVAASILAAPYANGHSVVSVLSIGVIPFFQKKPLPGLALLVLASLPFLFRSALLLRLELTWYSPFVLVVWSVLLIRVYRAECRGARGHVPPPINETGS